MPTARVIEIECKSVLNRVAGMGFKWSVNPYRGCAHGCHYCFARRYHGFLDLNPSSDFSGMVYAKVNAAQVIRNELRKPSWKREAVTIGTATDPYQPIEGKYRITRSILRELVDHHTPFGIVTKGPMIVRDVDILAEAAQREGCNVCFSVTTLDRELARDLDPGTAPPMQRLKALERLREEGVTAGVLIAPVVPGLTSDLKTLEGVVRCRRRSRCVFRRVQFLAISSWHPRSFLELSRGRLSRAIIDLQIAVSRYPRSLSIWSRGPSGSSLRSARRPACRIDCLSRQGRAHYSRLLVYRCSLAPMCRCFALSGSIDPSRMG